jgi:hypothetical protein
MRRVLAALTIAAVPVVGGAQTYPRTLAATAEASGASATATGTFTIHVDQLMTDRDFKRVSDALKKNGYQTFLPALRAATPVGYVQMGDRKTVIRYARVRADKRLVLGTDHPIFFVGAGVPDPKPRTGYEVAVIELDLDAAGNGTGTMAAAARVRPAPDGGVIVDDYAAEPVKLSIKPAK